jgi:hypothetical protein
MGITVNLSKTAPLAQSTRGSIPFGVVFAHTDRSGAPKTKRYANLGKGTKLFSVNLSNGELASSPLSKDGDKVVVTGKFNFVATILDGRHYTATTRGALAVGDVFTTKDGGSEYVHLGNLTDGRYVAFNLSTKDYALAPANKGSKKAVKIGNAKIDWAAVI